MRLIQSDPHLRLGDSEIYLDATEPKPFGIVTHGHGDHIARHERFVATPATAAFMRQRLGNDLEGTELAYETPHAIGPWTIELAPAGHVLGSAMVKATMGGASVLYTGDFRLSPSFTAEPAVVPTADSIVMESTYGSPEWRFPSHETLRSDLIDLVSKIVRRGHTAVLLAYSLGKAQEVMAMLRGNDPPVVVHPAVASIATIYERFGVDLGAWETWSNQGALVGRRSVAELEGRAVVVPPHLRSTIRGIAGGVTIALTGWSLHPWRRQGTDFSLPLSDHADYPELLEIVQRSGARTVYVTHGSSRFAKDLRERGIRADFLRPSRQSRLF